MQRSRLPASKQTAPTKRRPFACNMSQGHGVTRDAESRTSDYPCGQYRDRSHAH